MIASHGLEYEIEEGLGTQAVSIADGGRESRVFTLRKVVNSPRRAVSGDFPVHSSASPDSSIPPADRLSSFLAAGVEVLCSTEHDNLFDFGEALEALIEGRTPEGLYSEVAPGRFCVGFTKPVFLDRNGRSTPRTRCPR